MELPSQIPSPLGGVLSLRFVVPDILGKRYGVYWSSAQGYGRVYPPISDADLAKLYNNDQYANYLAGSERKAGTARPRGLSERLTDAIIFRAARVIGEGSETTSRAIDGVLGHKSSICDVGCGSGVLLAQLAQLGHDVTGVEPDPEARKTGQQRGLDIRPGTGEDLAALGDLRFDLVVMTHSLEHTREAELAIANCRRHLKPGGHLWIEVPNADCCGFELQNASWFHADVGRHIHYFSARSLKALVERAGLTLIEFRHGGYSAQFAWLEAAGPKAKWTLLGKSALASPAKRYSSVTVIARNP
jgi:2-polyprenyl-3-methyl-5-hydroxy-6-metoxy-1,4-benzoquinol methylase